MNNKEIVLNSNTKKSYLPVMYSSNDDESDNLTRLPPSELDDDQVSMASSIGDKKYIPEIQVSDTDSSNVPSEFNDDYEANFSNNDEG